MARSPPPDDTRTDRRRRRTRARALPGDFRQARGVPGRAGLDGDAALRRGAGGARHRGVVGHARGRAVLPASRGRRTKQGARDPVHAADAGRAPRPAFTWGRDATGEGLQISSNESERGCGGIPLSRPLHPYRNRGRRHLPRLVPRADQGLEKRRGDISYLRRNLQNVALCSGACTQGSGANRNPGQSPRLDHAPGASSAP
jgi:hypothetical protein